jgi:hypothetical protein
MKQIVLLLLILFFGSCAKQEPVYSPLAEQALNLASMKCQNGGNLEWLRKIIELCEVDVRFKGSIYAIQYSSGVVFLHQPWISSCYACNLYSCEGDLVSLSEGEKSEIIAGASEQNLIYSSTQ